MEDEADEEEGQHADPEGIGGERIEPEPAQSGKQSHRGNARAQPGINHQRREQVDLGAQHIAQAAQIGFQEDRQESDQQDRDGIQPVHCVITQTCSRRFKFTASLTRASRLIP